MVRCVLSQLKPSELYILNCEKGLGLRRTKNVAKNVEHLGICHIRSTIYYQSHLYSQRQISKHIGY